MMSRGTRTSRRIDHIKTMLTIIWNPNGFHFVGVMPKGEKYSA
jgi:hypothetical protein